MDAVNCKQLENEPPPRRPEADGKGTGLVCARKKLYPKPIGDIPADTTLTSVCTTAGAAVGLAVGLFEGRAVGVTDGVAEGKAEGFAEERSARCHC